MISYYELLTMIKEGNVPNKIKLHLANDERIYIRKNDLDKFYYYGLENDNLENYDFKYYLGDCLLDSEVFDKNIEIIEEEKKIPETLEDRARFQYSQIPSWFRGKELIDTINENFEKHQKAIYELIDYLKSKGDE